MSKDFSKKVLYTLVPQRASKLTAFKDFGPPKSVNLCNKMLNLGDTKKFDSWQF